MLISETHGILSNEMSLGKLQRQPARRTFEGDGLEHRSCTKYDLGLLIFAALVGLARPQSQPVKNSRTIPLAQGASQEAKAVADSPCTLPGISAQRITEAIDSSYALPSPLAADAMIRIAIRISSTCPVLAKDLLRRAFEHAETVEPQTGYDLASGTRLTDSRVSYAAHGYSLAMDRLSLQSRVVVAMAPLEAQVAIQLFQTIPPPRPPAVGCSGAFVPDVSIYYKAMEAILEVSPRIQTRNVAGVQTAVMLVEAAGATTSPVQLFPLATVVAKARLTNEELSSLLSILAAGIDNFPVDDRSLSAYRWSRWWHRDAGSPSDAIAKVVALSRKHQVPYYSLVRAYRDYLDRSMKGPHCSDDFDKDVESITTIAESTNKWLSKFRPVVEPISMPDPEPPIDAGPDEGEYWRSPKADELLLDAKHLNFDDNWRSFTEADRKTIAWRDRVEHMLNDMDNWREQDEPESADYYHQRCMLLYQGLEEVPPGPLYDRILLTWIATFEESSLQWDRPAEWYYEVLQFIEYSKKNHNGSARSAGLSSLKDSSNAYLHASGVVAGFLQ